MKNMIVLGLLVMWGCDGGDDKGASEDASIQDSRTGDTAAADNSDNNDSAEDLPSGPAGLDGYCERYKECGGIFYATAEDCVEATVDYWGDCPQMQAALDAFGDCMIDIPCDDYDPDSYNPASTDCAAEWSDINDADC